MLSFIKRKSQRMSYLAIAVLFISQLSLGQDEKGEGTRIKDLTNVRGIRSNSLIGIGLIVGLSGTGDSAASLTKNKALANMLTRLGMLTGENDVGFASAAAVLVTAELSAFQRNGDRINLKISTIGDASSLAGGMLISTPLRAGDGLVYVLGEGSVVTGQADGAGVKVKTVALVPEGGVVEREFRPVLAPDNKFILSLKVSDPTTNSRVTEKINSYFQGFFARSLDPVSIEVKVPPLYRDQKIEFLSELESLRVDADHKAVIVLNERTGTVVMGNEVKIEAVAISHGDLMISIGADAASKSKDTAKGSVTSVKASSVGELVQSMNALGVKPADLIGIVQAIHAAGAIHADIKFL